jgi:toxin secretion/phage lysis holin
VIVTVIGAISTWIFGIWTENLTILCILMMIDYITGLSKGASLGKIDSDIGWRGISKKVLIFLAIFVSHLLDKILFEGVNMIIPNNANLITFNGAGMIRNFVIWFYITNEIISIFENLQETGMKPPKFMKQMFTTVKEWLHMK